MVGSSNIFSQRVQTSPAEAGVLPMALLGAEPWAPFTVGAGLVVGE